MATALLALATAVPAHQVSQADAAAAAATVFGTRVHGYERMARVFETTGIRKRHLVRPLDWFMTPRGWEERSDAFLEGASDLFVIAATRALDAADVRAADVDAIVTVTSTGIAAPSLEARVAGRMGFRADVERVPIFGLGCAGGVSGLTTAARLAEARPGTTVLFIAVETCSLAFRPDDLSKASIVATALFADGAAACVLRAGAGGRPTIEWGGQRLWPDTLDIMGWRVEEQGLGVVFDRAIPPFAEAHVGAAVEAMLAGAGLVHGDIARFVCHPGGTKVVDALEHALRLASGDLADERAVLADYGNMSAPTVLFVLERVLARGLAGRAALLALGPGFTASGLTLRAAA
ncbi:type III polyketide synthase [Chelatococcus reniformis]|uniref:type III polyketide synthase n=1 Tax=Chelatococcus reniformis TaxID=1494448 RepID=UPI001FCEAF37|nr:type III polyketide synthase [Chelatococcus reniformis]